MACAHVFYLSAIVDEGITRDGILIRTSGEVDTNIAGLEMIALEYIGIGIVDKHAFLGTATHAVLLKARIINEVEKQTPITRTIARVIEHIKIIRIHQGIRTVVSDRHITAHLAVIGIHVMNRKSQILKIIIPENIVSAGGDKNAVTSIAQPVVFDYGPR